MKKNVKERSINSKANESVKQDKKEFKIEIVKVGRLEEKTAQQCDCECFSCECGCVAPDGMS